MIIPALAITSVVLLVAYARKATPGTLVSLGMLAFCLGGLFLSIFTMAIALAMFIAGVVLGLVSLEQKGRLVTLSVLVLIALAAVSIPMGMSTWRKVRLRDQYPYLSLRQRVQPVSQTVLTVPAADEAEEEDSEYERFPRFLSRRYAIASLHRSAVSHFLETPEFGVQRMAYPSLRNLEQDDGSPIQLPPSYDAPGDDAEYLVDGDPHSQVAPIQSDAVGEQRQAMNDRLEAGHRHFSGWFLDRDRFGDVQDLDRVAGFLPHAIVEDGAGRWNQDLSFPFNRESKLGRSGTAPTLVLKKLQLVGLLYHEEPVVYQLDTLPELLSADTATTRPLDSFEKRGLEELQRAGPVYAEHHPRALRMLGALRSSAACVECHDGPTTQLLGAFSYELEPLVALGGIPLTRN